jgi:ferric enterobactin receptor
MIKYGCLLSFLAICLALSAQENPKQNNTGSIKGKVLDSLSSSPVEYASITLYLSDNTKPVSGTVTKSKGLFIIDNLGPGNYRLVVEFIGYHAKEKTNIVIGARQNKINTGTWLLSTTVQTLSGFTVTAEHGLIENKIDKMVYNAEKDITSQGGVATDLLKKIPMISVDVDGNVELQGNANIRFLINGKPSSIFGNNLADALQSIPASQIKSIEVITSPGAKYDAEGTGGIINIILKDSKAQGINGSLNLSTGARLENGSFNLNARKGNFGASAYFTGNAQLSSTTLNSADRIAYDSLGNINGVLLQNGQSRFQRNGFESGIGVEWNINKKSDLTGGFGYDNFGNATNGYLNQQLNNYDSLGHVLPPANSITHSSSHFRGQSFDGNLDFRRQFSKEGQELDVSFQSSNGYNRTYVQQLQDSSAGDLPFAGTNSNNTGRDGENSLQADYIQPLSEKSKWETGGKVDIRKITSTTDAYSLNTGSGGYDYDSTQSNLLIYNRHVYAGYTAWTFHLLKIFDMKAGIRYERTLTAAGFFKTPAAEIPSYNTWAPSIILSHGFEHSQTIKVSYTKRIQRPGYRALNPFVNTLDPKNISQGNPLLKPEIGNNYELAYIKSFDKGGSLNIVFFYRRSAQDIQPYIVYYPTYSVGDSVYTNVSVNTPENIGIENNYGLNIYGSVPFTSRLNVRTNLSFFDRYIQNSIEPGSNITSFNYRININATYQFSNNLVAEAFGNFNSPRNEVQGRFPSFTSYNFAFRKQVWKKKGSFGFTTTNPFNKYVNQTTAVLGQGFLLNSSRKLPFRSFGISFMYKFGKLEFKKEKDEKSNAVTPDESN